MLAIEDVSVRYGVDPFAFYAVRDVTLHIKPGESFGIVGESGSGKSTLLRAIAGLAKPTAGRIAVDGKQAGAARSLSDRRLLQYIFQDPYGSLHPRHTVDRVLREPLEIHSISGVDSKVAEVLSDVGLSSTHRYRYPHQLSGGQRQRVAIARALILAPKVLLLDEPTSALDVSVQAEILNLLSDIRQSRQLTSILVSHDLAVVAHLCDRVAIMKSGVVVEVVGAEALRHGKAKHEYTNHLLEESRIHSAP